MRQDIQRPPMRLNQRHERWLYAIAALIFLSGLGWLADHYLFAGSAEFGDAHAPSELWWLRLHGAAAMAGLVVFGSLFPGHIARALRSSANRRSGLVMLSIVISLILTGWCLYYVGDEETRPWISMVHWLVGIMAGAGLVLHVRLGKRRVQRLRFVASSELPLVTSTPVDTVAVDAGEVLSASEPRAL
jgi:hypothetical protein